MKPPGKSRHLMKSQRNERSEPSSLHITAYHNKKDITHCVRTAVMPAPSRLRGGSDGDYVTLWLPRCLAASPIAATHLSPSCEVLASSAIEHCRREARRLSNCLFRELPRAAHLVREDRPMQASSWR